MKTIKVGDSKIAFLKGDITTQSVDAIVNAANSSLLGGGGVDGAIHRAAGPKILEECKEIVKKQGKLPTGQAVITTGANLPAKYVIHTVGPIYSQRADSPSTKLGASTKQSSELRSCYIESLKIAAAKKLKSIAFPSISTGAYRYPLSEAAPIAIQAVKDFPEKGTSIKEVYFVLFNDETYGAYIK